MAVKIEKSSPGTKKSKKGKVKGRGGTEGDWGLGGMTSARWGYWNEKRTTGRPEGGGETEEK